VNRLFLLLVGIFFSVRCTDEADGPFIEEVEPPVVYRYQSASLSIKGEGFAPSTTRHVGCSDGDIAVNYDYEVRIAPVDGPQEEDDWIPLENVQWRGDSLVEAGLPAAFVNALAETTYDLMLRSPVGVEAILPGAFSVRSVPADTDMDTASDDDTADTDDTDVAGPVDTALFAAQDHIINGQFVSGLWSLDTPVAEDLMGNSDNVVHFDVSWNMTWLYVGILVVDGNLLDDSFYNYDDDSVEIFIDPDDSRSETYDAWDRHYVMAFGHPDELIAHAGNPAVVLRALALTVDGYAVELAVPWTALGVTPHAGMRIGFDIYANDDDDGGGRDGFMVWSGGHFNYADTSEFGTVILSDEVVGVR